MRNTPSAMQCTMFKDIVKFRRHASGGKSHSTGSFTALHTLSLMNSAACNGTYGSCVGGALGPSFIPSLHLMWAWSLCCRESLFVVFEASLWMSCPFPFESMKIHHTLVSAGEFTDVHMYSGPVAILIRYCYCNFKRTFPTSPPRKEYHVEKPLNL